MAQPEKDPLSGKDTTGHEWDGIKELNSPLPRWWLWTFYATIIWGVAYTIVYPSWPTLNDYFRGLSEYSSRQHLARDMTRVREGRAQWLSRFEMASVKELVKDSDLLRYAMAGGRVIFGENCAPCHGSGGAGAPGYPVLADDDWLWGGDIQSIFDTVRFGVRSGHEQSRVNEMPKFGVDQLLTADQIDAVTDYVLSLSAGVGATATGNGRASFAENCAACHGEAGRGMTEVGGPNLADGIWLYGGSREAVRAQISNPKHGVMPAWTARLDDVALKMVSVYVHALGGGK